MLRRVLPIVLLSLVALDASAHHGVSGALALCTFMDDAADPLKVDLVRSDIYSAGESHVDLATATMRNYLRMSEPSFGVGGVQFFSVMTDNITLTGPGTSAVPVTFSIEFHASYFWDNLLHPFGSEFLRTVNTMTISAPDGEHKSEFLYYFLREDTVDSNGNHYLHKVFQPEVTEGTVDEILVTEPEMRVRTYFTTMLAPGQSVQFLGEQFGQAYSVFKHGLGINGLQTASAQIDLPAGYGFTSESGVFLSQAVPEPASWAGMALGMFIWGGQSRRRNRKRRGQ